MNQLSSPIEILTRSNHTLLFVEGVQLLEPMDDIFGKDWIVEHCVVVMGTSMLQSAWRRVRESWSDPLRFMRHYFLGTNKDVEGAIQLLHDKMKKHKIEREPVEILISQLQGD